MSRQENKLAPRGVAARAGNFLLNLAVAFGWLLRWLVGVVTGTKRR